MLETIGRRLGRGAPRIIEAETRLARDVGPPILAAAAFQAACWGEQDAAASRLKGGCGQDWPPYRAFTQWRSLLNGIVSMREQLRPGPESTP